LNHGDLLHGDMHGVVSVPNSIAGQIPGIAAELLAQEAELIELCQAGRFSLDKLRHQIERMRYAAK
jgi:regulator of RNase E activity RraA